MMAGDTLIGKVAIVTGGGRGIGRAIALALSQEGASVALAARTSAEIEAVAQEIHNLGGKAAAFPTDVSAEADVERLVRATVERFGHADILVNNAGIANQGAITQVSEEEWDRVMAVNVTGVFLCSRSVIRQMLRQDSGGSIINISSYGGKVGLAYNSVYCASKFAVLGLTESMARELAGHNIRVNAICPGRIDTKMMAETIVEFSRNHGLPPEEMRRRLVEQIPWGRMGATGEIGQTAVFLASDASSYVTAQAINVNGGLDTT